MSSTSAGSSGSDSGLSHDRSNEAPSNGSATVSYVSGVLLAPEAPPTPPVEVHEQVVAEAFDAVYSSRKRPRTDSA